MRESAMGNAIKFNCECSSASKRELFIVKTILVCCKSSRNRELVPWGEESCAERAHLENSDKYGKTEKTRKTFFKFKSDDFIFDHIDDCGFL